MATLTGVVDTDAAPEAAVSADARVRADLARLLQERLVHESRLGVWVHPILIAVIATLAWPDAPHDLLLGWAGAVVFTALLRGAWLFIAPHRRLSERSVRTGVRATVSLLAITWGVCAALVLPVVFFETTALVIVICAGLISIASSKLYVDTMCCIGCVSGHA